MFVNYSKHNEIKNLFMKMRPKAYKANDVSQKLSKMIKLVHAISILSEVGAKGKEREDLA